MHHARITRAILVPFGVLTVVFIILRLTGDPCALMLSDSASEGDHRPESRALGLDQPSTCGTCFTYMEQQDRAGRLRAVDRAGQLEASRSSYSRYPATRLRLAFLALVCSVVPGDDFRHHLGDLSLLPSLIMR